MSRAFDRLATVSCSTKRSPDIGHPGTRSVPATNLTGLTCTPLDPVNKEVVERVELEKPYQALQCFVKGNHDIKETDILVANSIEYVIRAVGIWAWPRGGETKFTHLVLEDAKVRT